MRITKLTQTPATILAAFIIGAFGLPVLLGLSWLPQPFLHYQPGMPIGPAHLAGYDNFSFAHVDWPWRLIAKEAISSGEWPLWNPYASLGLPFPEQYQNQLFFPVEWLEIFLGPIGWNVLFVCKVFMAGLGTLFFLRRLFPDKDIQIIGGVVYCFSAYFLWFNSIAAFVNGATLVPWLFWGALRLFDTHLPAFNRTGTLALIIGLSLLSGQPQISALTLLALFVFISVYVFSGRPVKQNIWPVFLTVCAFTLGTLIAAVQLVLFWQMSIHGYSLHSPGAYAGAATSPLNFLLAVWPFVFGQLMDPWDGTLFPGRLNAEGWPIVVGNSGLVLLAISLWASVDCVAKRKRIPPAVLGMFAVAVISVVIVVSGTLGFSLWNMWGLDRVNFPRYITPVLSFAMAVIICWGISVFTRMYSATKVGLVASLCLVFAFLAHAAYTVIAAAPPEAAAGDPQYLELSLWETLVPLFLVVGTMSVGLTLALRNPCLESRIPAFISLCILAEYGFLVRYGLSLSDDVNRLVSMALICIAAFFLLFKRDGVAWIVVGLGFLLPVPLLIFSSAHLSPIFDPYQAPSPATEFLRNSLGPSSSGGRVLSTNQILIPNVSNAKGIAELSSLNPKQIDTTADYIFKLLATHPLNYTTPNAWPGVQDGGDYPSWNDYFERRKFYNLISVRFLIDYPQGWLATHPQPDIVLAYSDSKLKIYEDKRAFTRAFSISAIRQVNSPDEAYSVMLEPYFDTTNLVTVEVPKDMRPPAFPAGELGHVQPAVIDELRGNRVVILTTVQEPSVVVLTDAFYPGWTVEVDGKSAPLLRVAGALRGVSVQAGVHKIIFSYRPRGLLLWSMVSMAAAFVAIGMIFLAFLRSRRKSPSGGLSFKKSAARSERFIKGCLELNKSTAPHVAQVEEIARLERDSPGSTASGDRSR